MGNRQSAGKSGAGQCASFQPSPFTGLKKLPPGVMGAVGGLVLGGVTTGFILSATPLSLGNAAAFAVLMSGGTGVCGCALEMGTRLMHSAEERVAPNVALP